MALLNKVIGVIKPWNFIPRQQKRISDPLPPVFLIGVPRSGTTIIYQVITNYFDVLYPDNWTHVLSGNLPFGVDRSVKRFGYKPHNVYRSFHGKTWMFGWHAPSEFTTFFRRFFKDVETHFISGDSDLGPYRQLKEEVDAVSAVHGRKILIKNLGLSLKITFLSRLFPGAKFIHVRRDVKEVVHSIDTMRKQLGIPEEDWWSIKPSNYQLLRRLDYPEKLIGQVKSIDQEIQAQVKHLRPENILEVDFEEFLLNFESEMNTIQTFIGAENRGDNVLQFIPNKPTSNKASLEASFLSAFETAGLA